MTKRMSLLDRALSKVSPEPNTGCWLWTGGAMAPGYGVIQVAGRARLAHRIIWQELRGPIPDGMVLDHVCRTRPCVNPDHLRIVSPRINAIENSDSFAAKNAAKSCCPVCGNAYSPEGRLFGRRCHVCKTRRMKEYRRRPEVRERHNARRRDQRAKANAWLAHLAGGLPTQHEDGV